MAERSFPFTSDDGDRKYGSSDFREFLGNILGNGRLSFVPYDIPSTESLLCSIDTIDKSKVNVSIGACFVNGAGYITDSKLSIQTQLPTGSTILNGYIVARIDVDTERKISITWTEKVDDETDLILAIYEANNTEITAIKNTNNIAYSQYNMSAESSERLKTELVNDSNFAEKILQNDVIIEALKTICPFPVKGVYTSLDTTNPSTLWPGTKWDWFAEEDLLSQPAPNANLAGIASSFAYTSTPVHMWRRTA